MKSTEALQDGTYIYNPDTRDLTLVTMFKTGYWVAQTNDEMGNTWIDSVINRAEALREHYLTPFVGIWTYDKDGTVFVDASHHVDDIYEAIALGRRWNQKSIWDIKHGTEIHI
jgi:hypothetical protein